MATWLVDAHCHFDFPVFDGHRDAILAQAEQLGISTLVVPGTCPGNWERIRELTANYRALRYAPGIHPWWLDEVGPDAIDQLEAELNRPAQGRVAIGECGLDWLREDYDGQLELFRAQVTLASRYEYPLLIHSVRTHDEVAALLKREQYRLPALVHGFSGSLQQATRLLDQGLYIGVGGVITHDRARKTRDTIRKLPASALVLETDAPDMPPSGVRKGENTPLNLRRVFESLCELRGEQPEVLAEQLRINAERLFMGRLASEGLHGEGPPV
ncbi:TatD DNase family protein [Halospina denitrificans]|uniref:TatD DNase family protein n=1 Tax=Halospina denitrificans TaxID=332522 RepID=A0A4R7JJ04_9GAMM|nr:TatD family hydrolase [Halospina denitrificans]TDT37900.1 TatD DNase family protein [Halospina denitrificans]